jgi:hypothetical protein
LIKLDHKSVVAMIALHTRYVELRITPHSCDFELTAARAANNYDVETIRYIRRIGNLLDAISIYTAVQIAHAPWAFRVRGT